MSPLLANLSWTLVSNCNMCRGNTQSLVVTSYKWVTKVATTIINSVPSSDNTSLTRWATSPHRASSMALTSLSHVSGSPPKTVPCSQRLSTSWQQSCTLLLFCLMLSRSNDSKFRASPSLFHCAATVSMMCILCSSPLWSVYLKQFSSCRVGLSPRIITRTNHYLTDIQPCATSVSITNKIYSRTHTLILPLYQ